MPENLMNSSHKTSNDKYRDGWERTFGKPDKDESKKGDD